MKKDTFHTLKRSENFKIILIGEGLLTGLVAGLIVMLYRIALTYAGKLFALFMSLEAASFVKFFLWMFILLILALAAGALIKWEPLISGSGIPQLEGEMSGKLSQTWWKILLAKFTGGFLCLLGGLSLGREGPSIQLGAMAGKGISKMLDRGKTEEKFLLTCGASAGLAAAFHAPLAGVMFSLEEVHKNFSVSVLLSVMTASIAADFLSSSILGMEPVFQFDVIGSLPLNHYWMLLILGLLLGALGAFYNWSMLAVQRLYKKPRFLNQTTRLFIPFFLSGILAFTMPSVLGSGHELIMSLTSGKLVLGSVLLLLLAKFIFSAISFGSGAPGGIFFPLLVLGAFIGGGFGMVCVQWFHLDPAYINNFVLLAMAGYFTAIVRAPLTGIILIFEMTGSVSQMLSLSMVCIAAYIAASLLKSRPIYESLLDSLLKGRVSSGASSLNERIMGEHVIMHGSSLENHFIRDIDWPENCLLVAVAREGKEIIPKGNTLLLASDTLVILTDERSAPFVHDSLERLCSESLIQA